MDWSMGMGIMIPIGFIASTSLAENDKNDTERYEVTFSVTGGLKPLMISIPKALWGRNGGVAIFYWTDGSPNRIYLYAQHRVVYGFID